MRTESTSKPKPIHLTLRQVARAALKAHNEDRLQATTKSKAARSTGGCFYRDGKNSAGETICCVIGAAIPDGIARAWDEDGLTADLLFARGRLSASQPKELAALQELHDGVVMGTRLAVTLVRKLHSLAR